MATILALNAVSSLLAAAGLIGLSVRRNRQIRRKAVPQPIYVVAGSMRPRPGH